MNATAGHWAKAHSVREGLLAYIQQVSGVATLYDVRRTQEYDAENHVDRLVNLPKVKASIVQAQVNYRWLYE